MNNRVSKAQCDKLARKVNIIQAIERNVDEIVDEFNCEDSSFQEDTEWKLALPWNKIRTKKNQKTYLKRKLNASTSKDSFDK